MNKNQNSKNFIHKINWDCNKSYIGQTSRPVKLRINEHKEI